MRMKKLMWRKSLFALTILLAVLMSVVQTVALSSDVPDESEELVSSEPTGADKTATIQQDADSIASVFRLAANQIPDGIYTFQNLGNLGFWMDIRRNSEYAGYNLQQYKFTNKPENDEIASRKFRVTQVGQTGRYIIRSLLNTNLSFGFVGDEVLTKTIPANDSDVEIYDTFYIKKNGDGYTIRPADSSYYISAQDSQASGLNGAPDSNLKRMSIYEGQDRARWILEGLNTPISNGIYAFRNIGNGDLWMDIERNIKTPGAHLQQYAYNNPSITDYTPSSLFRVTQIDNTGRYVIRLMLNENLSFAFSGTDDYIYTKEIPPVDKDVDINDTFYIKFNNGGYTIIPYGEVKCVAANSTTASGMGGAPQSFLKQRSFSEAGNNARWEMTICSHMQSDGVYWLSNDYGVTSGYYVMGSNTSYSAGATIGQWRKSGPPDSSRYQERWIIRHIGCGYYTIASSKKPDMYVSENALKLTLRSCRPDEISATDSIQWKIESVDQSQYRIYSKTRNNYIISVPTTVSDGAALELVSDTTVSRRGYWALNKIDDVYIVSIYSIEQTNGNSFMNFGHAWIKFENLSSSSVKFGQAEVRPNEYATVGKWGNQDPKQMWYNLELTKSDELNTTKKGGHISVVIGPDELSSINACIAANYNVAWELSSNCTHLACSIWNSFNPEITFSAGNPFELVYAMKKKSVYIPYISLLPSVFQGYQSKPDYLKYVNIIAVNSMSSNSEETILQEEYLPHSSDFVQDFVQ